MPVTQGQHARPEALRPASRALPGAGRTVARTQTLSAASFPGVGRSFAFHPRSGADYAVSAAKQAKFTAMPSGNPSAAEDAGIRGAQDDLGGTLSAGPPLARSSSQNRTGCERHRGQKGDS